MLFVNSMSLMWLTYYAISLVVLVAVYFALAWLPRLPRLVTTWCVAGAMWVPAGFSLPLVEEGEFYNGWAPAAMVSAVSFMEHNTSAMSGGLMWLVLGMALGAIIGIALWWWRRPIESDDNAASSRREPDDGDQPPRRREPVIG